MLLNDWVYSGLLMKATKTIKIIKNKEEPSAVNTNGLKTRAVFVRQTRPRETRLNSPPPSIH